MNAQTLISGSVEASSGTITASSLPSGWHSPTRISEGLYEVSCPYGVISSTEVVVVNRTDYLGYALGWRYDTTAYRFETGINTASNQSSIHKDGDFSFVVIR